MSEEKGYIDIFYNSKKKKDNKNENDEETVVQSEEEEFTIEFINKKTRKIGDGIYFYVDGPNYQIIPDEWKQEIQFVPPVPAYIKRGGKYEPVGQDYYQQHKYQTYYWIDGTDEMDCPACSGDGLILGDDFIEYTCPRCKGIGHLYFTTTAIPIKGITTVLRKAKLTDMEDSEETVTIKYLATPPGAYITKTLTEDELISEEEIDKFLKNKYGKGLFDEEEDNE